MARTPGSTGPTPKRSNRTTTTANKSIARTRSSRRTPAINRTSSTVRSLSPSPSPSPSKEQRSRSLSPSPSRESPSFESFGNSLAQATIVHTVCCSFLNQQQVSKALQKGRNECIEQTFLGKVIDGKIADLRKKACRNDLDTEESKMLEVLTDSKHPKTENTDLKTSGHTHLCNYILVLIKVVSDENDKEMQDQIILLLAFYLLRFVLPHTLSKEKFTSLEDMVRKHIKPCPPKIKEEAWKLTVNGGFWDSKEKVQTMALKVILGINTLTASLDNLIKAFFSFKKFFRDLSKETKPVQDRLMPFESLLVKHLCLERSASSAPLEWSKGVNDFWMFGDLTELGGDGRDETQKMLDFSSAVDGNNDTGVPALVDDDGNNGNGVPFRGNEGALVGMIARLLRTAMIEDGIAVAEELDALYPSLPIFGGQGALAMFRAQVLERVGLSDAVVAPLTQDSSPSIGAIAEQDGSESLSIEAQQGQGDSTSIGVHQPGEEDSLTTTSPKSLVFSKKWAAKNPNIPKEWLPKEWGIEGIVGSEETMASEGNPEPKNLVERALTGQLWSLNDLELLNHLGHGNFGVVWSVVPKKLAKQYPRLRAVAKFEIVRKNEVPGFLNSLECHSKLDHVNVCRVVGFFVLSPEEQKAASSNRSKTNSDDRRTIVLLLEECLGTLESHFEECEHDFDGKKYVERAFRDDEQKIKHLEQHCELAQQMLSALHACKKGGTSVTSNTTETSGAENPEGVVHRDLKPENIFRGTDGKWKLGDFGLSRKEVQDDEQGTIKVGTLIYMASEIADKGAATNLADVYSLGVVLLQGLLRKKLTNAIGKNAEEKCALWDTICEELLEQAEESTNHKLCSAETSFIKMVQKMVKFDAKSRGTLDDHNKSVDAIKADLAEAKKSV